jgi:signal transduction histidine kinase
MGTLAILLVMLAVLQYDWVGQNAEHERQTMQTALHNLAIDFAERFNREIHRAYSYAEIGGEALSNREFNEPIERFAKWKKSADYPGLIKNMFLAVVEEDGTLTLMRLDESTWKFAQCDWPANLAGLRSQFDPSQIKNGRETGNLVGRLFEHGYIEGHIPAVLRFFARREQRAVALRRGPGDRGSWELPRQESAITLRRAPGGEGSRELPRAVQEKLESEMRRREPREAGLAIIELDPDYISQKLIPALAQLSVYRGIEYDLTVVDGNSPSSNIIYRAGSTTPGERGSGLSSDENATILATAIDSNTLSEGADWHVLVKHRAGSVEAAVARLRFKNLAVSFGILFLLAASVVIVIINARRSQQLARKQMEFVAGVSHEFRTPLAVIHAISENLADGLITDKLEIERCGIVIRDDVRRLAGMVEEVLHLAGAFRGKALYHRTEVDLKKLIERVLARYPQLSQGGEWTLEKEIDEALPGVLADATALGSALGNMLDNAIKYSGEGRWIRLTAGRQGDPQPGVVITVEDRGRGIAPKDLPHIFEPFYRGDEVRAAQIHGNGLGLSLVKNIIDAHGGTISVSSTAGQGTTFRLTLPASSGLDAATPRSRSNADESPPTEPSARPSASRDHESPATAD